MENIREHFHRESIKARFWLESLSFIANLTIWLRVIVIINEIFRLIKINPESSTQHMVKDYNCNSLRQIIVPSTMSVTKQFRLDGASVFWWMQTGNIVWMSSRRSSSCFVGRMYKIGRSIKCGPMHHFQASTSIEKELEGRKVGSVWIEGKRHWKAKNTCKFLLSVQKRNGFLQSVVTRDEKLIYICNLKRNKSTWKEGSAVYLVR